MHHAVHTTLPFLNHLISLVISTKSGITRCVDLTDSCLPLNVALQIKCSRKKSRHLCSSHTVIWTVVKIVTAIRDAG